MQLRETLRRTEEELDARDKLIDKYQLEIRQRNDDIEKKARGIEAWREMASTMLLTTRVCLNSHAPIEIPRCSIAR